MDRVEYYDRMIKNIAVTGIGTFFGIGNLIAWLFI